MISIPEILVFGFPNRGGWTVDGDLITAGDGGPVPTLEEIESHRAEAEAALAIAAAQRLARSTARAALAEQWTTLPAWIRGPFGATYTAAVALLDQADDAAAAALIEYASAPAGYSAEQAETFETIRASLLASIMALP
jgi:hypothetical protein